MSKPLEENWPLVHTLKQGDSPSGFTRVLLSALGGFHVNNSS